MVGLSYPAAVLASLPPVQPFIRWWYIKLVVFPPPKWDSPVRRRIL